MRAWTVIVAAALLTASVSAQPARDKSLSIYVVDVEGGNATLFIANLTDDNADAMPLGAMPPPAPGSAAPPPPVHNGPAHWIKVSASADGTFTIVNGRNGFTKRYGAG